MISLDVNLYEKTIKAAQIAAVDATRHEGRR